MPKHSAEKELEKATAELKALRQKAADKKTEVNEIKERLVAERRAQEKTTEE